MHAFRVVDKKANEGDSSISGADPEMEQIAALYGAKEIIRFVPVTVLPSQTIPIEY